jgi:hypothetical protein
MEVFDKTGSASLSAQESGSEAIRKMFSRRDIESYNKVKVRRNGLNFPFHPQQIFVAIYCIL